MKKLDPTVTTVTDWPTILLCIGVRVNASITGRMVLWDTREFSWDTYAMETITKASLADHKTRATTLAVALQYRPLASVQRSF